MHVSANLSNQKIKNQAQKRKKIKKTILVISVKLNNITKSTKVKSAQGKVLEI